MSNLSELVERLYDFSVPELCDGLGIGCAMDYEIKPRVTTEKIVGPAFTVKVPVAESGIVGRALEEAKPGDVVVIAGQGNCRSAYWGDYKSTCAKVQKVKGAVIDGAFRDVEDCEKVGVPIYAKAIASVMSGKSGQGELNVPVSCGGVIVNPGDIIVGDRNGVCVVPVEKAEEVMAKALKKRAAESYTIGEMERTGKLISKLIYPEAK